MCTATWLRSATTATTPGRLQLFFNRDESLLREPAGPPRNFAAEGVRWIAPIDGRAGGSWILATELGLALALLNRSGSPPDVHGRASRGLVPPLLAPARSPAELAERLRQLDLTGFSPFRLLSFWREPQRCDSATWDGRTLRFEALARETGIVCSSGLGDDAAREVREATWHRWRSERPHWSAEAHRELHCSHDPTPHAFSVCMHRPGFATVSKVEIDLALPECRLIYQAGSPCLGAAADEMRLEAAASASAGVS